MGVKEGETRKKGENGTISVSSNAVLGIVVILKIGLIKV